MKMKKLTALALAGVLCLGMSTTAFAAKSPTDIDAVNKRDQNKVIVNDIGDETLLEDNKGNVRYDINDWEIQSGETAADASVRIQNSIDDMITDLERYNPGTSADKAKYKEDALAELKKLEGKDLQLVTSADIDYVGGAPADIAENPVTVRFDLSDRDVKAGDKISVMHEVTDENTGESYWTVLTDVVVEGNEKDGFYVDYDFTSFSRVILLKQLSDGTNVVVPGEDPKDPTDPTNPDDPTNTLTPDANGNITADQLADLIVKKINDRVNATKVVRTAVSGKASPKTGE